MKRECVSRQYTIEVDLMKIMDSDDYHENQDNEDAVLYNVLSKLPGVDNVDYNGHFGPYVWVTIDARNDNAETWEAIEKLIQCSYDWV